MIVKTRLWTLTAGLAMIFAGGLLGPMARAECGKLGKPQTAANLRFGQVESEDGDPIVGFWKVKFHSQGNSGIPDGTVLDDAYAQWHSDGTEIMNSARAPETQSFCLGVWKKTKPSNYKLNHFAISWANGSLVGPANIREEVILSHDGDNFTGMFTIDQYDQAGNLLVHLVGTLEGKRITVDTPIAEVL